MTAAADLVVDVVQSAQGDLRRRWSRLAADAENPFATPEWHECWVRTQPGTTGVLLVVRRGLEEVVGVVPLVSTRHLGGRLLRAPGCDLADFSGPACAPEDGGAVGRAVARALRDVLGPRDLLLLERCLTGSGWEQALLAADRAGQAVVRRWRSDSELLAVPLQQQRSPLRRGRDRREIDRLTRRLHEHGVDLRTSSSQTVHDDVDALLALRRTRWHSAHDPAEDAFLVEVAQAAAVSGMLRLWLLQHEDRVVAGLLGWSLHGRTFAHLMAFETSWARFGPGTVLLAEAVASAVTAGDHTFDFLRGDEPHKRPYRIEQRSVTSHLVARQGVPAAAVVSATAVAQAAYGRVPPPWRSRLRRLPARVSRRPPGGGRPAPAGELQTTTS